MNEFINQINCYYCNSIMSFSKEKSALTSSDCYTNFCSNLYCEQQTVIEYSLDKSKLTFFIIIFEGYDYNFIYDFRTDNLSIYNLNCHPMFFGKDKVLSINNFSTNHIFSKQKFIDLLKLISIS